MRVVIVSRIYVPEPSAASFFLSSVAKSLVDAGHDVSVLTTTPPAGTVVNDPAGIAIRRSRVVRDSSGYVRGYLPYLSFDLPLALRLLARRRADLYIVEPPPTTGAVVRVITSILRRPYLYDAADVWADAAQLATSSRTVHSLLRWIENFAIRGAAHAVTISHGMVDRMRELGLSTPTTVVGFGADTSTFNYQESREVSSPYFVYPGTHSELQGADIFVDAFAAFSRTHPGHRLIFVGNGTEREKLRQRVKDLGALGVEFRDRITGSELATLLAGATASLASLKPHLGYDYAFASKIYSSIAVGCPAIFAGPGPTVDFLEEANGAGRTGTAVPYSVDAVTAALTHYAELPLSVTERRNLSEWTAHNHSLSAVANRVVAVAESIVSKPVIQ